HLFWKNVVFGHSPITPTSNNRYFVKPQGEDKICYEICKDSLTPVASFAIDFGDKHIPFRYGVTENSFIEHVNSDYYKNINTPIDNENYVLFGADGFKDIPFRFIINKNTNKGISFSESRVSFKTSDNNSFYATLPLEFDHSTFDKVLKRKLDELSDEKTYIVKLNFKF
ncbi:MAG: hypothetical protein RR550_03950, partial [Rikenellaceae bacterium]